MKNRFLKPVLPAFAILLAMGLAFAEASPTADREAYYKPLNQDCFKRSTLRIFCRTVITKGRDKKIT